jgi:iron complex transport system ATP-binding protein
MKLQVENLSFAYDQKPIIEDICFTVEKGEFVGLIGPNGSGKSTILKNLYRALKPDAGEVKLDGENLFKLNHKQAARKIGVVAQEDVLPFDFKVEEIVAMGRSPYKKLFDGDSQKDKEVVRNALAYLGMEDMAKRKFLCLSGGEKQRVLIARVIAQETDFLILDEPTNHLDIGYQLQIFDLVKHLNVTVLTAIHDLNIAALYCDRIYVLKNGRVFTSGTPEEV